MFISEVKKHLIKKIIPFWNRLKDAEYGGFYGYVDSDLKVDKRAVKGCILNSRILWFYSNAYMVLKDDTLLSYADHAYDFLKNHCLDDVNGGVYWSLNYDGTVFDDLKHTYNQAFAIYALSSYYSVTNKKEALDTAFLLFELIETKCRDDIGYMEAFTADFKPESNEKLSENGVMAEKTMNTLLHVLEAYTELLRVSKDARVAKRLSWIFDTIEKKLYNPALCRQEVFFDREMNSIIDLHSYGHDIEAAWLIDRGLEVLNDPEYTRRMHVITADLTKKIYERAYREHSLLNECERGVDDEYRIWWGQAEAVVGFLNGYQRDGREEYLEAACDIWTYIQEKLTDPREGGEWYWRLKPDHTPDFEKPIVEPWKCPYHNGRMCIEIIKRGVEPKLHPRYYYLKKDYDELIHRHNYKADFSNGIYARYKYPVLTAKHAPLIWKYDLDPESNPLFVERLGINAAMNSGAIYLNGKYYLIVRVEGNDRKSFFAVAESDSGIDGFEFWDYPILLEDTCPEETNVYDMRLTQHEDGYIYGVFCSESKDETNPDLSAAVAAAGIVRTKDLKTWERLPNLVTLRSPQQRNVVLHPEFVNGKYAFYTRPMDDFIDTGSGGGIGFGLCDDITHAVIDEEIITSKRKYHTITEVKNGAGAVPIKTPKGWIHIAHGVRNTAAGLRYVIYAFATDLNEPWKVIAEPSGLLIGPLGDERVGDVSNVAFTNGAIVRENGDIYIYYASSDTRMHVATTTMDKLVDYVFNTPKDPLRSVECVAQRNAMISDNLAYLRKM